MLMSEENFGLEIAKEAIKEVGKDVYSDVGKPIAKPTGELIGLVPRAIKAALSPLEKWIMQREYNVAETQKLLELKLQNVSPELIEPPEPYIAVPALQYISYCMDCDELRDMYANLLANSMNKVVKNGVHPGFLEIVKQLCPDEAKLLNYIYTNNSHIGIPIVYLEACKTTGGSLIVVNAFTNAVELCGCEHPNNYEKYIDNLERLGLISCSQSVHFVKKEVYTSIKEHTYILNAIASLEENEKIDKVKIVEGSLSLTKYGMDFCSICLETPNKIKIEIIED